METAVPLLISVLLVCQVPHLLKGLC